MIYDAIIIGAGAAGMTAALNILRNNKTVLIIEKEVIGGQISTAPLIENYPAIKEISGMDFSTQLFDQITALGVEFQFEEVLQIKKENNFIVTTEYRNYESKTLVIAAGAQHKKINIKGEKEFNGKGVSYCATCDGAFFKGKDIAVIGGSDTALVYALFLSNLAKNLYLCMRRDTYSPNATNTLKDRIQNKENVKIMFNVKPVEIKGDTNVTSLLLENTLTNDILELPLSAVFVAIGEEPKTDIYSSFVDRENGYIITDNNMQTKTDGLYAIGDVRVKKVRQLTTAESDAAIAAYSINERLS